MPLFDALTTLFSTTSFFSAGSALVNDSATGSGHIVINADDPKKPSSSPVTQPSQSSPSPCQSGAVHSHNHNTVVVEHSPVRRCTPSPTKNLCAPMRHCSTPPPPRAVDCCQHGPAPVVHSDQAGELHVAVPQSCHGVWGDPKSESCKNGVKKFTFYYHGQENNDYRLLKDHDLVLDGKVNSVHLCGRTDKNRVMSLSTVRATTANGHEIQIESNGYTLVDGHELPVRASIQLGCGGDLVGVYHSPKGVLLSTNHGRNHVSIETHGSYINVLPEGNFQLDAKSMFGWLFAHKTAHGIPTESFNLSNIHEAHIHPTKK